MASEAKASARRYQMYINGEFVDSASQKYFLVVDPSTEEVMAEVSEANETDVNRAVAAAKAAFDSGAWPQTTAQDRGRILFRLAERIRKEAPRLAELEARNSGKPIVEAEYDINDAATCFEYYGGMATKILGQVNPVPDNALSLSLREPIGVAAQIIPWNYPLLMAAWKLAPAIAAGCTCILKPAEQTPLTALRIGELILEADLPEGVVNIVTGFGETAGAAIASHPDIDKVAFTGSTEVGKLILQASAGNLKRVSLELGGKSPNIIFPDADLEDAVPTSLMGFCMLSGQVCCAGTRVFVQNDFHDRFVDHLTRYASKVKAGDPLDANTMVGPLVSKEQFNRVNGYIGAGKNEGAKTAIGGEVRTGKGFFVDPTIFTDVKNSMKIAREEIFGPVAAVIPFKDENDAVFQGNDTTYGLAAAVWTRDVSRAFRVARAIKAGTVWVNCYNNIDPISPFGGYKQSGIGRELGKHSLDLYTQIKSVYVKL